MCCNMLLLRLFWIWKLQKCPESSAQGLAGNWVSHDTIVIQINTFLSLRVGTLSLWKKRSAFPVSQPIIWSLAYVVPRNMFHQLSLHSVFSIDSGIFFMLSHFTFSLLQSVLPIYARIIHWTGKLGIWFAFHYTKQHPVGKNKLS